MKDVIVLGGPNGAGKSTAVPGVIPPELGIVEFVNADEIARGLSPLNPAGSEIAAGRLLIERIRALRDAGQSFGFETTCAGREHAALLRECRALGYRITLIFLWLPSPAAALQRVARRVREGGHGVERAIVTRRYAIGPVFATLCTFICRWPISLLFTTIPTRAECWCLRRRQQAESCMT
ncbi:MAG TPA: AAA family ATPase [Stellaceae bacterium]